MTSMTFIDRVRALKHVGYTERRIAEVFGMSIREYRERCAKEIHK